MTLGFKVDPFELLKKSLKEIHTLHQVSFDSVMIIIITFLVLMENYELVIAFVCIVFCIHYNILAAVTSTYSMHFEFIDCKIGENSQF